MPKLAQIVAPQVIDRRLGCLHLRGNGMRTADYDPEVISSQSWYSGEIDSSALIPPGPSRHYGIICQHEIRWVGTSNPFLTSGGVFGDDAMQAMTTSFVTEGSPRNTPEIVGSIMRSPECLKLTNRASKTSFGLH